MFSQNRKVNQKRTTKNPRTQERSERNPQNYGPRGFNSNNWASDPESQRLRLGQKSRGPQRDVFKRQEIDRIADVLGCVKRILTPLTKILGKNEYMKKEAITRQLSYLERTRTFHKKLNLP